MLTRIFIALGALALSGSVIRGNVLTEDQPVFSNAVVEASDIFLGIASSLTYKEDESPLNLSNDRDWLSYEVTMLPIRVLKGDIIAFNKYKPEETGKEINVLFRDRSPFSDVGSPKVYCRPTVGLVYIVFLNKTKTGTYELNDVRLGILPIDFDLIGGNDDDIWNVLIKTLRSEHMPMSVHEDLFNCLNTLGLEKEKKL